MRTQGSMFVNNMKAGVQNQRSSSSYFDGTCDATNAMVVRHGSFLPWHWSVCTSDAVHADNNLLHIIFHYPIPLQKKKENSVEL